MPNKCCAPGCKSGYKSNNAVDKITFHKFPLKNKTLLNHWLIRISRENFEATESSRICSLHFVEEDFVTENMDTNPRRKKGILEKRRLRNGAIPTRFRNLPSYYSTKGE